MSFFELSLFFKKKKLHFVLKYQKLSKNVIIFALNVYACMQRKNTSRRLKQRKIITLPLLMPSVIIHAPVVSAAFTNPLLKTCLTFEGSLKS